MQSESTLPEIGLIERVRNFAFKRWETLTDQQKSFLKKGWNIITYKWRWQIALNIPYLAIFVLDRTVPSVHEFNMKLVSWGLSYLPIPEFISKMIG